MRILGVDTGGTFTDLVLLEDGAVRTEKVPSTPHDPSRAVLDGIERLGGVRVGDEVVHGTTVALNALLTGRIARTALVTNEGFGDLIEIGRQDRPELYALEPTRPAPLTPRHLRFELPQRSAPDEEGSVREIRTPSSGELRLLCERLARARPESAAVCLLHSYADPAIERRVAETLAGLGIALTCSAELLPEYREFERFSTALVNAALVPVVRRYLDRLSTALPGVRISILQSSGGTLPVARAASEPARVLFSGPAGGVVGAARAARESGLDAIVTLDMGGTSTDVAFHEPGAGLREAVTNARVAGHPVALPALDIHTIGTGGGSLCRVDAGGVLRVGPQSAGADPGPVCYGHGDVPTVTDAHVLLGHVAAGRFLGGRLDLDVDAVVGAFERLGKQLGMSAREAARAVLEVARAQMRRAVGVMTMQRGRDPRALTLVAFGGAGGLHAAALAESLEFAGALVPLEPGVLSAAGMARATALSDHSRAVLAPLDDWPSARRRQALRELDTLGREALRQAGHPPDAIEFERAALLRYEGQSFELAVDDPIAADLAERFHSRHAALYGWKLDDRPLELVALRSRALVREEFEPPPRPRARALPRAAIIGERVADFGRPRRAPLIDRAALGPGVRFEGPALVEEYSGTTLVPPRVEARVTAGGHLHLIPPGVRNARRAPSSRKS